MLEHGVVPCSVRLHDHWRRKEKNNNKKDPERYSCGHERARGVVPLDACGKKSTRRRGTHDKGEY